MPPLLDEFLMEALNKTKIGRETIETHNPAINPLGMNIINEMTTLVPIKKRHSLLFPFQTASAPASHSKSDPLTKRMINSTPGFRGLSIF